MPGAAFEVFADSQRSNWIRLQTLVTLRWVATFGQSVAIAASVWIYELTFSVGLAALTVFLSVFANVAFATLFSAGRRLSEREASAMLAFDLTQLGVLLYLTGGLNNPFALLLLAPVTIAATVLQLRSTVFLGAVSIAIITVLSIWNQPLFGASMQRLELPEIYLFGFWLALVTGVVFLAIYARQVTSEIHAMRDALVATQLALARGQKLTDLGGVVAATAHELGTPLATIKLVSAEMMDDLGADSDLHQDAALIREQANRCKDILQSMGQAGKDDLLMHQAPIGSVVQEAADPHMDRGKLVLHRAEALTPDTARHPHVTRRPEIIHGLRNLIQNAVDFANQKVEISVSWSDTVIMVRIKDDGPGFPASVIGRIGDPFVRRRRAIADLRRRPEYDGMGLGLFIAKTLLERTGARLNFANAQDGRDGTGAVVIVEWSRSDIEAIETGGLGENRQILA